MTEVYLDEDIEELIEDDEISIEEYYFMKGYSSLLTRAQNKHRNKDVIF